MSLSKLLSELPWIIAQMFNDGYKNIFNLDVCTLVLLIIRVVLMAYSDTQHWHSSIAIEQMGARNHSRPEMQCTTSSL